MDSKNVLNSQLFDLNKKGTIIIGTMRSGSNFLRALVGSRLAESNIPYNDNGEYFTDRFDVEGTDDEYSYFNMVEKLQKVTANNDSYSVGTIVYTELDMISCNPSSFKWYNDNYHLIKLYRRNYINHFMSHCIFLHTNRQYKYDTFSQLGMPLPVKYDIREINNFIKKILELNRFPCDNTLVYEDIEPVPIGEVVKNIYNITPKEFFADYDKLVEMFNLLEYNVG